MNATQDQELLGTVDRIIYAQPETGFTVFLLHSSITKDPITVQGTLPTVRAGQLITVHGTWKMHPKFGKQFYADRYHTHAPTSIIGLKKYLGSGLIKGIGPMYAQRLVDFFGQRILEIIDTSPQDLARVPGIGEKRCSAIIKSWQDQKEVSQLMIFLQEHNITTGYAVKIHKRYGARSLAVIQENPYQLAHDVWGIGFKTADQLAQSLGFAHDGDKRISAGIIFSLTTLASQGALYTPVDQFIKKTISLLTLTHENAEQHLEHLITSLRNTGKIEQVEHEEKLLVALSTHYATEKSCAQRLATLKNQKSCLEFSSNQIQQYLHTTALSIQLHDEQHNALIMSLTNNISIITGGPGTGKTTIIKTLLQYLDHYNIHYLLAAPTGRAAKRMMQTTGRPAVTLHRLLEFDPAVMRFSHNELHPLKTSFVIVDEASMIDIFLAHALLKAVPEKAHLLFIGDVDQLPSVGPGNFLRDLIDTGIIACTKLTHIFRQAHDSLIVVNAHRINNGQMPTMHHASIKTDFLFIKEENPEYLPQHLEALYRHYLPACSIATHDSIVLAPLNRGIAGTQQLNYELQRLLNSTTQSPTISYASTTYKIGDRVMQIRNNYDKEIFNGDIGSIQNIDTTEQTVTIDFGDRTILYEINELDELVLSYAISIHKSQGSEYQAVIIPIFMQHFMLLARNLLYTAVTRAKKVCIIIGQPKAIAIALRNNTASERTTLLKKFIQESA